MGFLKRLFTRPLSQDAFAKMLTQRLRASGETGPIEYDAAQFRLSKSADAHSFLSNFYQQYLRLPATEHENLIRNFLATWHTTGFKAPEDFQDAKADLLPALRARSYLEINIPSISPGYQVEHELPHLIIAEHLAVTLVYDLPHSMMSVSDELLTQWGITFYEALEVAKENLQQTTREFAQLEGLYAFHQGDGYDATRMLLTDLIHKLKVSGDTIAMVPNREALYVCGSEDEAGLALMAKLTAENVRHERSISGLAFRLVENDWEVWMPPKDHPSHLAFEELRLQSIGQTYAEQKDLLDKRHQLEGTDLFVASFSGLQNQKTGRNISYCMWCEDCDSLLPETEQVFFFRPNAPKDKQLVARGTWDHVRSVVGDLMEPQGSYPERWRVKEFPSDAMLKAIGNLDEFEG